MMTTPHINPRTIVSESVFLDSSVVEGATDIKPIRIRQVTEKRRLPSCYSWGGAGRDIICKFTEGRDLYYNQKVRNESYN